MERESIQKHIVGILVENRPGVLARIVGLFSGRNFNIENITAAETHEPGVTRITLVTSGDDQIMTQIVNQLRRLINVIRVIDFREKEFVDREMALVKVNAEEPHRAEILRIVNTFRANVVDESPHFYTLEITGNESKISAFIELLKDFSIVEIARTGKAALARNKLLEPEREEALAHGEKKEQIPRDKTAHIKVSVDEHNMAEFLRIVEMFRGRIVDAEGQFYTVEVTGNEGIISAIWKLLKDYDGAHISRRRKISVEERRKLEFQWGELLPSSTKTTQARNKKH